jgi:hypothetical protein
MKPSQIRKGFSPQHLQVIGIWSLSVSSASVLRQLGLDDFLGEFLGRCGCHVFCLILFCV